MTSILQRHNTIVTRFKSARQKAIQNQNLKTLNKLLKQPNMTVKNVLVKNISVSVKKSLKKVVPVKRSKVKRTVDENMEYYPDLLKRNAPAKKVILKPRHEYKVVAATNKRKRRIPHREVKSPPFKTLKSPPSIQEPEMSIEELVRISEDQGLDDEDLMEILTCPSPVWWEDLEDQDVNSTFDDSLQNYSKELNSPTKLIKHTPKNGTKSHINEKSLLNGSHLKSILKKDQKFNEKRSKLENVLGNIKVKKCISGNTETTSMEDSRKTRKESSSEMSDISFNDEELLHTLESIEIPVRENGDVENTTETKTNNDSKDIYKENFTVRPKRRRVPNRKYESDSLDVNCRNVECSYGEVPSILPPLTKKPFINTPKIVSPKSSDSLTTNSNSIEIDSISDTNIKFLDEYEDQNKVTDSNVKLTKNANGDFVTVYRIIPTNAEENVDVEEQIQTNVVNKNLQTIDCPVANKIDNGTINSFYKKCKKSYRSKGRVKKDQNTAKSVKPTKNEVVKYIYNKFICKNNKQYSKIKKPVNVPNSKVRYCHKCSSIFETNSCEYCKKISQDTGGNTRQTNGKKKLNK